MIKSMITPKTTSPYSLLQEELWRHPWKVMIACIMLNQTGYKQVRGVIWDFFEKYPDALCAANADSKEMAELLKPLGLYNRRAKTIIRFSREFNSGLALEDCYGIGKYALDSYKMFCGRSLDVEPTDSKLKMYLEWAHKYLEEHDG